MLGWGDSLTVTTSTEHFCTMGQILPKWRSLFLSHPPSLSAGTLWACPWSCCCCWSQVPVINGLFFLAGRRQHSSSTLHDQRLIESMDTPHVYLRNSRRYSWLLIFAQVTLGCIFLRCRELLCRNSSNDQVSSALENFLEVVSLLRGLGVGGLFWFFGFFFSWATWTLR